MFFDKLANNWWEKGGKFDALHAINPLRIGFVLDEMQKVGFDLSDRTKPLKILDLACGGGIASESMARYGHNVTAIDESPKSIEIANQHALEQGLAINYLCKKLPLSKAESQNLGEFDIILAFEMLEHLDSPREFANSILPLLKPDGALFISTINRNLKSLLLVKFFAEYVIRMIPQGAHEYNKFLKPSEVATIFSPHLTVKRISGISFNPLKQQWHISEDVSMNYLMMFQQTTNFQD